MSSNNVIELMGYKLSKQLLWYIIRFGGFFSLFYFGSLLVIGLSSKENIYSSFVANHLDFITPLRNSILHTANWTLQLFNYPSFISDDFTLSFEKGRGVRMVYSCVGYGVISFWFAFVIANSGSIRKKIGWMLIGFLVLWVLNVLRVLLLLLAINKDWPMPFTMDHHTLYNIVAYCFIFLMMYVYDRGRKATSLQSVEYEN